MAELTQLTSTEMGASTLTAPFDALEVGAIIADKGLSDTIMLFIAPEQISDIRLCELWETARRILSKIETYIDNEHFRINSIDEYIES